MLRIEVAVHYNPVYNPGRPFVVLAQDKCEIPHRRRFACPRLFVGGSAGAGCDHGELRRSRDLHVDDGHVGKDIIPVLPRNLDVPTVIVVHRD